MDRSIGFEKTWQVAQYEPVKISTYVNNIPQELWMNDEFMDELYTLIISESIGAFYIEREIVNGVKNEETTTGKIQFVDAIRNMSLKELTKYNINITIEEK
jgi:hypothetical protein